MSPLSREDLKSLMSDGEGLRVSIYLPTHRTTAQAPEDKLRLKNLIRDAERQLAERGATSSQAAKLLAPAHELADEQEIWLHHLDGIALFSGDGNGRRFTLPLSVPETAVVNRRYYVRPLFPLFNADAEFFILALSQNQVRLFRAGVFAVEEVPVKGIPKSLKELLQFEERSKELQLRSSSGPGVGAAMFHGHGDEDDRKRDDLLDFFRHVNRGVIAALKGQSAPLVLASVEAHYPIYREANTYAALHDRCVPGNPERVRPEELRDSAWELLRPLFESKKTRAIERYHALVSDGKASSELTNVLAAARAGRVDTLLVASGVPVLGSVDDASGEVRLANVPGPEAEDLGNLAAIETFLAGGTVYLFEASQMPDGASVAAVFRY